MGEAFTCQLLSKTLGIYKYVHRCKALIEINMLCTAAALEELTKLLEVHNAKLHAADESAERAESGWHMTQRTFVGACKEVQLACSEAVTLAPRYAWHTMALAISNRPGLYDELAFVYGVTPEEAAVIVGRPRGRRFSERFGRLESDATKLLKAARADKDKIATACGFAKGRDEMCIKIMPVTLAREFAQVLSGAVPPGAAVPPAASSTSSSSSSSAASVPGSASGTLTFSFSDSSFANVKEAVEHWYAERCSQNCRIYVYQAIPRGIGAMCAFCRMQLDGNLPTWWHKGLTVHCRRCKKRSTIKRTKSKDFVRYFAMCAAIRGVPVPEQRRKERPLSGAGRGGGAAGAGGGGDDFSTY